MTPRYSFYQEVDCSSSNAEVLSDTLAAFPKAVPTHGLNSHFFSKLCLIVILSSSYFLRVDVGVMVASPGKSIPHPSGRVHVTSLHPSFSGCVSKIIQWRTNEDMPWVCAWWIITCVTREHSVRNRPNECLIHESMCSLWASMWMFVCLYASYAVSIFGISKPSPEPTAIWTSGGIEPFKKVFLEKVFGWTYSLKSHGSSNQDLVVRGRGPLTRASAPFLYSRMAVT